MLSEHIEGWFGILFVEIPTLSDNTSACTAATGAASQFSRMMHVSRRQHYIRDCLRSKFFRMQWRPGEWNPADALTKRPGKKLHMSLYLKCVVFAGARI